MLAVVIWAGVFAGGTAPDSSNPLVAYGLLGVILVAAMTLWLSGRLVSGKEFDRVVAENVLLRQQQADAILAQAASSEALKESTKVLRDVMVEIEVLRQTAPRQRRT